MNWETLKARLKPAVIKRVDVLLPGLLYAVVFLFALQAGLRTADIPWANLQLLDKIALTEHPWQSLYLLHGQPPVLNALLAILIQVSEIFGLSLTSVVWILFNLFGLVTMVMLYETARLMFKSRQLALLTVALVLSNPAYLMNRGLYFYTFLILGLLSVLLYIIVKFHQHGLTARYAISFSVVLALITNTRSLFHPLWLVIIFALNIGIYYYFRGLRHERSHRKIILLSGILLLVMAAAWPVKNAFLFGTFTYSTWIGLNLARDIPVRSPALQRYLQSGAVSPQIQGELKAFGTKHAIEDLSVLSNPRKSDGSQNWNHFIFTKVSGPLAKESIRYRLKHPKVWLQKALTHYIWWSRASFVHPYSGEITRAGNYLFRGYSAFYRQLFYPNLRFPIEKLFPGLRSNRDLMSRGRPLPFTLFGMISFPLFLMLSIGQLYRSFKAKDSMMLAILVTSLFTIFWTLLVPCLTDGREGNRMRLPLAPYMSLLTVLILRNELFPRAQALWKRLDYRQA